MSYLENMFSLSGQTVLITGATRGIGQSLAIALARAGADIILVQRDAKNLDTLTEIIKLGGEGYIIECDLSDMSEVKNLVRKVTRGSSKPVDILVNCGGIQRRSPAENFTDEDWSDVMQVNLNAVWTLSRDVGRHMLEVRAKEGTSSRRGKIINIASLLSFQGGMTVPAYAAAKAGVLGLTKALSNEWSGKGINVNAIAPGYIATDMNEALIADPVRSRQIMERIPAGRWGSPSDFEGAIIFLASRASDYVCGECLTVDGGWMAR